MKTSANKMLMTKTGVIQTIRQQGERANLLTTIPLNGIPLGLAFVAIAKRTFVLAK
jgi:hypothetical protein